MKIFQKYVGYKNIMTFCFLHASLNCKCYLSSLKVKNSENKVKNKEIMMMMIMIAISFGYLHCQKNENKIKSTKNEAFFWFDI